MLIFEYSKLEKKPLVRLFVVIVKRLVIMPNKILNFNRFISSKFHKTIKNGLRKA